MATATGELDHRKERATRRRAAVSGALAGSEAGPGGAAVGAVTGAASAKSQAASSASASAKPSRARRAGQYAGKRGKSFAIKKLEGPQSGALFAEYFGGALVIILGLFTKGPSKGYLDTMSEIMMRLTALTAVFFVLFLMQGSKRGGQAAVWLGLLIDLGIIFTAARGQTFSTTADIVSGKGTGVETAAMTSALTVPQPQPGVTFPDE